MMAYLLFVLVVTTLFCTYAIRGKSDGFAPTVVRLDAVDHILTFLLIGILMFIPWMYVWGGYVDSTMTNEEKFSGFEDCDVQEEELPIGTTIQGEEEPLCSPSNGVIAGYFISGILAYALCYRSAIAILKTMYIE